MAGNKNPWRDIPTVQEWQTILDKAKQATPRQQAQFRPRPAPVPDGSLDLIKNNITQYHAIDKDYHGLFIQRITLLNEIARLASEYVSAYQRVNLPGTKSGHQGEKVKSDQLDVWARSLAHRAAKKSAYLTNMEGWHQTAKDKYKDRLLLSMFLRKLAEDHLRDGGERLHATPYATIEKIDPYHRQTFVFLDPEEFFTTDNDEALNEMGHAFLMYLEDDQTKKFQGATNGNPSFYEWLEYSPFCIGTPGITGEEKYKDPRTVSYAGHDLTHVLVTQSRLIAEQVRKPGVWNDLNTSSLRRSGKGPIDGAAFVWDNDCNLFLHPHGQDGFVHASVKQGKSIRCSGMLVAKNGLVTYITNESGHYAPEAKSIFNFGRWLHAMKCVGAQAIVEIEHGTNPLNGQIPFSSFQDICIKQGFPPAAGLRYPQQ